MLDALGWKKRAVDLRARAAMILPGIDRQQLLILAENCDDMAKEVERIPIAAKKP